MLTNKATSYIIVVFIIGLLLAGPSFSQPGPGGGNGGGGSTSETGTYTKTGAYEQNGGTAIQAAQEYSATQKDESGVYAYNGGTLTLLDSTINKTGNTSDNDESNFYGLNAVVLAEDSSTIILSNCTLYSNSEGSNGAFAYEEGSRIFLENCTITTLKNSSRGVDATYEGSVTLKNTTISTQGDHCAALATDRGGGTITAIDCTGTTQGEGSPGIYSTGTFVVIGGSYTANGSEAAGIEGLNSIMLIDTIISGAVKRGVMIYQSSSGDSSVGTGTFKMSGGSLINNSTGPDFFVCNTTGIIILDNVNIVSKGGVFLRAAAPSADEPNTNTSWGNKGGTVMLTALNQVLSGHIECDENSVIDLLLSDGSNLEGAVDTNDEGDVSLTLNGESIWTATADSYVSELMGVVFSGSTPANIDAASGVTIFYSSMTDENGNILSGTYTLASGGTLQPL